MLSDLPPDLLELARAIGDKPEWAKRGLCTRAGDTRRVWFTAGEKDVLEFAGRKIFGREAQQLAAEKYCLDCEVQWDCAQSAVAGEVDAGVWGCIVRDILWLQRIGWGEELIEYAREEGVPVQVAVRNQRHCDALITAA